MKISGVSKDEILHKVEKDFEEVIYFTKGITEREPFVIAEIQTDVNFVILTPAVDLWSEFIKNISLIYLMPHNKIIITGDAGRGKSTLAARLSEKLQISHYSTDDFYYEVKFSQVRDRQEALRQIRDVFDKERWIVEGTTAWLLEPGMKSADRIVYLYYKNILSQWWTIATRGLSRKDEKITNTFKLMKHVFYKRYSLGYKKGKMTHREFIAPYTEKVITLSSFQAVDRFAKSFDNGQFGIE